MKERNNRYEKENFIVLMKKLDIEGKVKIVEAMKIDALRELAYITKERK